MKIIRSVVTVLRDKNDLPVLSLCGDLDFCIRSYQQTLLQNNLDVEVLDLCKTGYVQICSANVMALDDNNVKLNCCSYENVNYKISTSSVLTYTDFTDKAFRKASLVALKNLSCEYEKLEKEVTKKYECGKNEQIRKINADNRAKNK